MSDLIAATESSTDRAATDKSVSVANSESPVNSDVDQAVSSNVKEMENLKVDDGNNGFECLEMPSQKDLASDASAVEDSDNKEECLAPATTDIECSHEPPSSEVDSSAEKAEESIVMGTEGVGETSSDPVEVKPSCEGTSPPRYQTVLLNQAEANPLLQDACNSSQELQAQSQETPLTPSTSFDAPKEAPEAKDSSVHQVKWITFNGAKVPIITQNENGPCPMIALANVLLLRQKITLPADNEVVSGDFIIATLSDVLLSFSTANMEEGARLNYEENLSSAFGVFPSLQTGLDVNVRFTGVADFEYTPALGVFDLFSIPLYHGWVADPQDTELARVLRDLTYNQVVEMIIDAKASDNPERIREGLLAEEFLEGSLAQLTLCGLFELSEKLKDGQLAVLFRNNHFNTIYKKAGAIYMLVTDVGFVNEPNFVWETLNNIDGNSQFVNSDFKVYTKPTTAAVVPSTTSNTAATTTTPTRAAIPTAVASQTSPEEMDQLQRRRAMEQADLELARRLQEEENAAFYKLAGAASPKAQRSAPLSTLVTAAPSAAAAPVSPSKPHQDLATGGKIAESTPAVPAATTASGAVPTGPSDPSWQSEADVQARADYELAQHLQAEENAAYYRARQQQQQKQTSPRHNQFQRISERGSPRSQQRHRHHNQDQSSSSSSSPWKCTIS